MSPQPKVRLIGIDEASSVLGVSRDTVYAYVSRGLIRSEPDPRDPRLSLYGAQEVALLAERNRRGRSRRAIAASSVDWGDPVLRSTISRVEGGKLRYRGTDAVELSRSATIEEAATLLWQFEPHWPAAGTSREVSGGGKSGQPAVQRCVQVLAALHGEGPWSPRQDVAATGAARLLCCMAAATAGKEQGRRAPRPMHLVLSEAWTGGPEAADTLRRCLVLCADHELNASTYAARVVASTRAPPGACALAGIAALTGPLHGGMTDSVLDMLAAPGSLRDPGRFLAERLARGEAIPGFGHRLYPDGDPRAAEIVTALCPSPRWYRFIEAAEKLTGWRPNIDFGLAMAERLLRLPAGSAFALFATGRLVGWIAHALEQRSEGTLIRPRAEYVGP